MQAAKGQRCSQASDIWSLGCVLAEMALRRPLLPCHSPAELLRQVAESLRPGQAAAGGAAGSSAAYADGCGDGGTIRSWPEQASPLPLELARVRRRSVDRSHQVNNAAKSCTCPPGSSWAFCSTPGLKKLGQTFPSAAAVAWFCFPKTRAAWWSGRRRTRGPGEPHAGRGRRPAPDGHASAGSPVLHAGLAAALDAASAG